MNWSSLNALPLGLLMFASLVWGYFKRRAAHRRAKDDYPALAERLGLEYRRPSSDAQIGVLHGKLRGFLVHIDPDDQRKLIVRFRGTPQLDLRNYESQRRPRGTDYFSTGDRSADRFLKTRYATPELVERLTAGRLAARLPPFFDTYRHEVKEFHVTEHGITCMLDFGNPRFIPVDAIEALLPTLLDLAEVIEPSAPPLPSEVET
ncbi:MAG: hypothetical protein QM784_26985 [Polyangiaceae bacterium]